MNLLEDEKLQRLLIRRNLSEGRKKGYYIVFTEIYELINKSPSELIEEAKFEERPYIADNNQIVFNDIGDRKVTQYLFQYYDYLKSKNLKEITIDNKIKTFRALYNEYRINLPENIKIIIPNTIIREGDIPTRADIKKALEFTNSLRNKAIITLAASSGMRSGDMLYLKIKDFIEATKEYHKSQSVEGVLELENDNLIPCWYFQPSKTIKTGNICVTFNTPECSQYIIDYLKQRQKEGEILTPESDLFISSLKKRLSLGSLKWLYSRINKELFGKSSDGKSFFRSHNMRKFFITTCNHNSNDITKVNLLSGHTSPNSQVHNAYNEINIQVMKRFYTHLIEYLSFKDTDVKVVKSDEYIKLDKQSQKTEEENRIMKQELEEIKRTMEELLNQRA